MYSYVQGMIVAVIKEAVVVTMWVAQSSNILARSGQLPAGDRISFSNPSTHTLQIIKRPITVKMYQSVWRLQCSPICLPKWLLSVRGLYRGTHLACWTFVHCSGSFNHLTPLLWPEMLVRLASRDEWTCRWPNLIVLNCCL